MRILTNNPHGGTVFSGRSARPLQAGKSAALSSLLHPKNGRPPRHRGAGGEGQIGRQAEDRQSLGRPGRTLRRRFYRWSPRHGDTGGSPIYTTPLAVSAFSQNGTRKIDVIEFCAISKAADADPRMILTKLLKRWPEPEQKTE